MKEKINTTYRRLKEAEEAAERYKKIIDNDRAVAEDRARTSENFHKVEKKMVSILEFKDFFNVLLTSIKDQFNIPHVWISLINDSEVTGLIESLDVLENLKEHLSIIDKEKFIELTDNSDQLILKNKDLKSCFALLPNDKNFLIKSMVIAPISIDGIIIGSLNLGHTSRSHYHPDLDTSDLEHLTFLLSLCLSNVTAHEKLKFLAYHDPLTGLLNRRIMETVLDREFERSHRYANTLSVVFMDLDYFKSINDTYGHERGDDVLKYVSDTLMNMCRQSDIVSRFAGDEFVVILPETETEKATKLMKRIKAFLKNNPLVIDNVSIPVSISFGIASTNENIETPTLLLKKADDRLYKVKKSRTPKPETNTPKKNPADNVIDLPNV